MKKTVFLTGATGTMGWQGLQELLKYPELYDVVILARKSSKNEKLLNPISHNIKIVWGDLMNYDDVLKGVNGADIVLHLGGMVSPAADYYPEKTLKVNVTSSQNVVNAILEQPHPEKVKAVYVGSVAQTSDRPIPVHWGRTGDPIYPSEFDYYGVSKIIAERIFVESGLKFWVSLRQTGILYPGLLKKFDPIMFHVPINGVLEWATVEDSGRLIECLCRDDVPDSFWNHFYNISSGPQYRMTNFEFEKYLLKAANCPPPQKIFEPNWFVLKNFHGQYFLDSDKLENIFHFRANIPVEEYFLQMSKKLPWFYKLAKIVPPFILKLVLKRLANKKNYGTQYWIKNRVVEKIKPYYGSIEKYQKIPKWNEFDFIEPLKYEDAVPISHGFDESKLLSELSLAEISKAAEFRGGKLLSTEYSGSENEKLLWQCHKGHEFQASVKLILEGGHWCPECLPPKWDNEDLVKNSPFFAQIYNK